MNKGKGSSSAKPKKPYAVRRGSFLTPEEVADELAVTERMVRRMIHDKRLKGTPIGRFVRVHRDDLDAYIVRQRAGES